jgi:hypothetical protein
MIDSYKKYPSLLKMIVSNWALTSVDTIITKRRERCFSVNIGLPHTKFVLMGMDTDFD